MKHRQELKQRGLDLKLSQPLAEFHQALCNQNIVDFVGKQVLEVADMKDFSQKSFQKKFNQANEFANDQLGDVLDKNFE